MKQRPIIFNTEMVQAILDGRKTQTRRVLKAQPHVIDTVIGERLVIEDPLNSDSYLDFINAKSTSRITKHCPFGQVGDQLYVRETWRQFNSSDECGCSEYPCGCPNNGTILFKATGDSGESKWKPSIHMPRSAARIILEVTDVRVERLNDISEQDAINEGCKAREGCKWHTFEEAERGIPMHDHTAKDDFWAKWESTYGEQSWQSNPWVWVIEFKVISTTGGAA